ncbi:transcriptional regulator, MerR family [Actinobacillus ureae ATCC 25976]|uniref:Transcriptional regulator, MerR family n=2 Tax=Actinobacillus ureae TaxID=723 RepID=E8KKN1_9PAST|nr:transcriptional regulator, MerR family [Actinobacillus ureae ATCC 25976]
MSKTDPKLDPKELIMLKMNDLSKVTNTPKSTILYYIKEGLLPEPLKDKPNFHLYDESNIQLIEFIKYLQANFNATISQIKTVFAQPDFDLNNPYKSLMGSLDILNGTEGERLLVSEICAEFGITEVELNEFVEMGLINPTHGDFSAKDRDMLAILSQCDAQEFQLLESYAEVAKNLARQEMAIGGEILMQEEGQEERLKHFFNILLLLKPYILNSQLVKY